MDKKFILEGIQVLLWVGKSWDSNTLGIRIMASFFLKYASSDNARDAAYLHIIAARSFVDFFRANGLVCLRGYNKTKESRLFHFYAKLSESFKID